MWLNFDFPKRKGEDNIKLLNKELKFKIFIHITKYFDENFQTVNNLTHKIFFRK